MFRMLILLLALVITGTSEAATITSGSYLTQNGQGGMNFAGPGISGSALAGDAGVLLFGSQAGELATFRSEFSALAGTIRINSVEIPLLPHLTNSADFRFTGSLTLPTFGVAATNLFFVEIPATVTGTIRHCSPGPCTTYTLTGTGNALVRLSGTTVDGLTGITSTQMSMVFGNPFAQPLAAVPEPTSFVLVATGLIGLWYKKKVSGS